MARVVYFRKIKRVLLVRNRYAPCGVEVRHEDREMVGWCSLRYFCLRGWWLVMRIYYIIQAMLVFEGLLAQNFNLDEVGIRSIVGL